MFSSKGKDKDKDKKKDKDEDKDKKKDKKKDKDEDKEKDKKKDKDDDKKKDKKKDKDEDEDEEAQDLPTLFQIYSKFGDRESDGTTITLKNIDKWLKQAGILGDKKIGILNADTAITFSKISQNKKRIDRNEFEAFIDSLASDKGMESNEILDKMIACGEPKMSNATKAITSGRIGANVRRMTDASKYTGAHKERFDESGKGKGKAGREDIADNKGYVAGYKGKDSYKSDHTDEKKDDK